MIRFVTNIALAEVPVNALPLLDDTDFKTRETAVAHNAAGMDLVWNFISATGAFTQTAVTPTTGGVYDWTHQGDGIYTIEIPKSGGGSINNDAVGVGWFSGVATGVQFGQIKLSSKKLAALVPISNDLIRYSSPSADTIVRDDCVRSLAAREDLAFLRGTGLSGTPKGLKYWIASANKFDGNATASLANLTADLGHAIRNVMDADINLVIGQAGTGAVTVRPGWVFAPRTWQYLFTIQTGLGTHAFKDEMLRGTLLGWPFRVTTQIPITASSNTVDTGGTYSEIYFGAFAHAVIGEAQGLIVDASQEAAYYDGSSVVAAYSQDQTVIRVIAEHDFALRHDRAFSLIESSVYGA
jgi:HK97 family phage major capsid protein